MSGFAPPKQFRGSGDLRALLESNWRYLTTYLNSGRGTVEEWNTPVLLNSWANYSSGWPSAEYRKLADDRVELRGLVDSGAVGTTVFTLPEGYRPAKGNLFLCAAAGGGHWRVDVQTDGDVHVHASEGTGTPGTWLNLGQIIFDADG